MGGKRQMDLFRSCRNVEIDGTRQIVDGNKVTEKTILILLLAWG